MSNIKLAFLLLVTVLMMACGAAFASSKDVGNLGEEQIDEKQELEKMKQELGEIKNSINEGLQGISKVDTTALKEMQEFHLFCKTAVCEIAPGKTVECLTYNGILPGPVFRVKEGQLVRLIVHNQLDVDTSLDLHGLALPASVDSIPSAQSGLIKPGQTYAYQFIAKPIGTYWYHPQIMHAEQKARGMYGAFIVDPAGAPVKSVDQDIVLVLSDMSANKKVIHATNSTSVSENPIPSPTAARQSSLFARSGSIGHRVAAEQTATSDTSSNGYAACSPVDSHRQLVFYMVNGKTAPAITPIEVSPDTRIRLHIINSGQHAVPLHITGHKFEIVSVNGSLSGEQTARDTITVNPSDRLDLEFTANNPGLWSLGSELVEQSTTNGKFPGGIACLLRYVNQ